MDPIQGKQLTSAEIDQLWAACLLGNVEVVKTMLDQGVPPNRLIRAARLGSIITQKREYQVKVSERGSLPLKDASLGTTLLFIAAYNGHEKLVEFLLSRGASVDLACGTGFTPLICAAQSGYVKVVELLLAGGSTVDLADNEKCPPLAFAASAGHSEVVRLLLKHGANIAFPSGKSGFTPLHLASRSGHLDTVKLLLELGANMESRTSMETNCEQTPLFLAAQGGHKDVVILLLDLGANINLPERNSRTPLFAAAQAGRLEVVTLLLQRGANPFLADRNGVTAFTNAALHGFLNVVKVFVEHGTEVDLTSLAGLQTFHIAVAKREFDLVQSILSFPSARDLKLEYLTAALVSLLNADRMEIAESILLKYSTSKIAELVPVATLLVAKSSSPRSNEVLKLLVENGAKIDWQDSLNASPTTTALHLAVLKKQAMKVFLLSAYGADFSIPYDGKTVWALCEGDKAITEALLHFWSPQTHSYHPKFVRDAIICVMLVAKKQTWPFDASLMHRIFAHIAFGWYKQHSKSITSTVKQALGTFMRYLQ